MVRDAGLGSQTLSSQTSRSASGWAREDAAADARTDCRYRMGEEDMGELSTRTRRAEGVAGAMSTGRSKRR